MRLPWPSTSASVRPTRITVPSPCLSGDRSREGDDNDLEQNSWLQLEGRGLQDSGRGEKEKEFRYYYSHLSRRFHALRHTSPCHGAPSACTEDVNTRRNIEAIKHLNHIS